jgi:hypothetical protein
MTQHTSAKIVFVLPFNFSHHEETVDQIFTTAPDRMARGSFVFDNVSTFEPSGAVHGRKPAAQMAQQSEHAAHHGCSYLTHLKWTSAQAREHLTDEFAMLPLLRFDDLNPSSEEFVVTGAAGAAGAIAPAAATAR